MQLLMYEGVFLDISKAFDKVWNDGIIFELKAYCVEGELREQKLP